MLATNKYAKSYVDKCHRDFEDHVAAYRALSKALKPGTALKTFERTYFRNLILALDRCFVHRTRALEKKDGNPLTEVRMLCSSISDGTGRLVADSTIRYDAARSILKLKVGDEIVLSAESFERLLNEFIEELRTKY